MSAGISDQDPLSRVELLTVQQVAEWAKVTPKTIYRWIETEQVPVVKFGNRSYRIPARSVIEHLRRAGYEDVLDLEEEE
jgi:excisionase family DNA binding protein